MSCSIAMVVMFELQAELAGNFCRVDIKGKRRGDARYIKTLVTCEICIKSPACLSIPISYTILKR